MKTVEETKKSSYQSVKKQLDDIFSNGGIPNVKAFQKIIRDLKKRIKTLEDGACLFARSIEDVEKADLSIARLTGELDAYQERYGWIQRKLKENQ